MGRRKIPMKKIDSPVILQTTYTKRRDGILKKANELSVLCGADVGLLMFSPTGRLTRFSSSGRIEDLFLRYMDQHDEYEGPVENEERLYRSLKHSKYEEEMMEMIAKKEALEKKLLQLNQRHDEAEEKISFYQPKVENINTIREANVCQQYLADAIQRVQKLKEDELLGQETESGSPESTIKRQAVDTMDTNFTAEESVDSKRKRNPSRYGSYHKEKSSPTGPHLSIEFLKKQRHWVLEGGRVPQC